MGTHNTDTLAGPVIDIVGLRSQYGSCAGKSAYARETRPGAWQVKVHDPMNRLAGHDGWVLLGSDWPTLHDASVATGLIVAK